MSFLNRLGLRGRLLFLTLVLTSAGTALILFISYQNASEALISKTRDQMRSLNVMALKRSQSYLMRLNIFTGSLAVNRLTQSMFLSFGSAFKKSNLPAGQDHTFDGEAFSSLHEEYQERYLPIKFSYEMANFLLVNTEGQVLFSASDMDYGHFQGLSLSSGALRNSPLAKCYADSMSKENSREISFADYHFYEKYGRTKAFLCAKVFAEFDSPADKVKKGDSLGVIITEVDLPKLRDMVFEKEGMGDTGIAYVLGEDGRLLSDISSNPDDSEYTVKASFQANRVLESEVLTASKTTEASVIEAGDYLGRPVISGFSSFVFMGRKFVVITEKAMSEVMAPIRKMVLVFVLATLVVQLVLTTVIVVSTGKMLKPVFASLRRLGESSATLSDTSEDVSKFSHHLSEGVNQQGEVVQETTAAMAQMQSMLNQTTQYAKQSESVIVSVQVKANDGMNVMNEMVDSMSRIAQSNDQLKQMSDLIQEISKKTNVINEIVFKTQLLSFNASIEAARAGQHGRGFAVVAEEVGNLAKMSGQAAQEIGALLQNSERQVTEIVSGTRERITSGRSVTDQAIRSFREIAKDIESMAVEIGNISTAAREQELGVAQTSQAMSELNKTTVLNNSVAQKAQVTARTLRSEITALRKIALDIQKSVSGSEAIEAEAQSDETSTSLLKKVLKKVVRHRTADLSPEHHLPVQRPVETQSQDMTALQAKVLELSRQATHSDPSKDKTSARSRASGEDSN
jgi:methyl-accepting chemotaxis protein